MGNQEGNGIRGIKSKGNRKEYKGFVAGVFSGIAKLGGEFDSFFVIIPASISHFFVSCEKSIYPAGT